MVRPRILVLVAIAGLPALPACGGEAPRAAAPRSQVSEQPAGTLVHVSGSNRLTAVDVASGRRFGAAVSASAAARAPLRHWD